MLTFVTWKWTPKDRYRSTFGPETVNVLARMIGRHYRKPHRVLCVTDDAVGIDTSIQIVKPWDDYVDLPSPSGGRNPSCYRRLRSFDPAVADVFGPRFVSMDLDIVITADISPLFDRPEPFVIWGDTNPRTYYNGSLMLQTAGARSKVWTTFDPVASPAASKDAGHFGSDQGWISYCLGKGEPTWSQADGVYSFQNHIRAQHHMKLPENARLVVFHGHQDPWLPVIQRLPWVQEHYR